MIVISDIVRHRGDLGFERRPTAKVERESLVQFGNRPIGRSDRTIVLRQPFEQVPGEVQSLMVGIWAIEPHHGAQSLRIVIEPAKTHHRIAQCILARVAEWRMPEIVSEAERFGKVFIQPKRAGEHAADLCDFEAVCQARTVVIALWCDEHLRF